MSLWPTWAVQGETLSPNEGKEGTKEQETNKTKPTSLILHYMKLKQIRPKHSAHFNHIFYMCSALSPSHGVQWHWRKKNSWELHKLKEVLQSVKHPSVIVVLPSRHMQGAKWHLSSNKSLVLILRSYRAGQFSLCGSLNSSVCTGTFNQCYSIMNTGFYSTELNWPWEKNICLWELSVLFLVAEQHLS